MKTKPEQDKATARPWGIFNGYMVVNVDGKTIADCGTTRSLLPKGPADAAFIVKAVNEYDVLNAVAEDMNQALTMLEAVVASRTHLPPGQRLNSLERFKANLAALAALRKKQP